MRPYSQILDRLRAVGLRPTRQRMALARLLFDNGPRHVTAENLHAEAMTEGVRVSLATVYNTLHQFTEAGLLREITVDAARSYFDTNIAEHHHFYHEKSGLLEDIAGEDVVVSDVPPAPPGTAIQRIDVVIRLTEKA